jgi:Iap family predicted aminopeptidase
MIENLRDHEKDILGEAYISNETRLNLSILCSFGSRFAGTLSEKQAVDYILGKMEDYNLDNPHTEEVEYLGWKRGTTTLEVTKPEHKELDCIGLPWSPSTPEGGVEAELLNLGNGTYIDYELNENEVPGKIVMTTAFTPHWMRGQHRCEKLCRAENLGAAGFIYAKNDPGLLCETGVASWNPPENLGRIVRFPAVGTSKEVAAYLGRLQGKGEVKVRITSNHASGPALTWNVVGEVVGSEHPDEVIIAGAHFDGHDIAVGAMDDAAGACVVLEAARLLARHKKAVKRTVRFITFPGEETGDFGSAGYVLGHLDEIDKIKFMFNLDGAGRSVKPGVMVQGWPDAIPFFKKMSADMGQPFPVGVSFGLYSDHMPFALRGIRTASLRGSSSFTSWRGTRGWGHTKADTEDKVDIRDMREAAANLARILLRMASVDELPFERKSIEEIRSMLKKYGFDDVMEVLGSYPSWLK